MSQSQLKTDLIAMRDLLSTPSAWTQDAFARDRDGDICTSDHPTAVCWCLDGAAAKVGLLDDDDEGRYAAIRVILTRSVPTNHGGYVGFNDDPNTTHDDVMSLLNKAIEAAQ
ncbi:MULTISPECIES: hypothetical protein [unclassified Beijerinckia]|uniref:DUF6197 family protein n=1 Tax=unclassified Beijerinckia TaxID=2638183 RepID=UPI00089854C2|nr:MULTISPECIES: hypothetical protein [unclassified Beijerinckia]MDH7796410.1 hypothetical protein [Beijerinckia sp. GAS462]SEC43908.1 hypothetical protein SAMN05443249_2692 [Beijerinckia sp. 28-YEA-48]